MNNEPQKRRFRLQIDVQVDYLRDIVPILQQHVTPVMDIYDRDQGDALHAEINLLESKKVPNVDLSGSGSSTDWRVAITEQITREKR